MPASNANIPGHRGNKPEDVIVRQDVFLKAYAEEGTILGACKTTGISREAYERWKKEDVNGFAKHFEHAKDDFADRVEANMFKRALDPDCPPVIQIFALNGLKAEKYRQQQVSDETAKDVMQQMKSAFKGLKFEDKPTKKELSIHQQAEKILKSKSE